MSRPRALALPLALAALALAPAAARAAGEFGILPGSATVRAENRDGTLDTQAGSHPYAFTVHFALRTNGAEQSEGGEMRDVLTDLPPGLFGNPAAVPACPRQSFEGAGEPQCSPSTQVGVLRAILPGIGEANGPLYNLVPPPGVPAQLGFSSLSLTALLSASVRTEEGYAVQVEAPDLPVEVTQVTATIWGTPADPGHTPERGKNGNVASQAPLLPFLTLPTSCQAPPAVGIAADSKLAPGIFSSETALLRDAGGNPVALSGCEGVPFSPAIAAAPSTAAADSPAGLGFQLKLPNQGLANPKEGVASETEPLRTEVTLPPGLLANPAAVSGQGVCTPAQYEAATAASGAGQGCPADSKLGTLVASTPLLEEGIEGSVYLAAPHDNPFGSLLALYIVAQAPERGVLVKQAGKVIPDRETGQLTAIFDGLPPIPYSSFEVRLREGPRAPLITPPTCGPYTTTARLYPISEPGRAVQRSAPFTIAAGAGGGPCAGSEAQLPYHPRLLAGTTVPIAGAFSPFLFKLTREDGEQRLGSVEATLPEGLAARLAGVPYCPDQAIAAAAARREEGEGAAEVASPSCPAASRVGTVTVGAGAGPAPYYVQGAVYLAGPYRGAPLSLAIITPAIAGPFDLGTVVVRAAVYVNESNGQVTVKSDPLPQILHGLPLELRSVAVRMERPQFTLNPTSCAEKQISARASSPTGASASLANRFQVGSCAALAFKPKLALSLKGATRRAGHPAFKAVLTQPAGQANIASISVALPPSEFVDQAHIGDPCTRPQFAAEQCPPISLLGTARAYTPLLENPLAGNVYFRANGGERELPDVVADLRGQVHLVSVGFIDTIHRKGSEASRLRTTFATVPDAPVSKIVVALKGGKEHGLLVNSADICKTPNTAIVRMTAQNGRVVESRQPVATSCKKK